MTIDDFMATASDGGATTEGNTLNISDGRWHCERCFDTTLYWADGAWTCNTCSNTSCFRVTQDGLQRDAPEPPPTQSLPQAEASGCVNTASEPPETPTSTTSSSSDARRLTRRRRRRPRGGPGPPDADGFSETAESEALTQDPTVSLSDEPLRDLPRHPAVLPGAAVRPRDRRRLPAQGRPPAVPEERELDDHPAYLGDLEPKSTPARESNSSSSSTTWHSRMGPEKGVRWRGGTPPTPPPWRYDQSDLRAFNKWQRKVRIWEVQVSTFMTKREAALLLYNSLTGDLEAELEHADLSDINCDFILTSLEKPMTQKVVYQKRRYLSDYESLSRYPGESLRTFANRYRRTERNLEALGVSIMAMYDGESRGNRLLERARLSLADQRLILVGSQYSLQFDQILESMVMQFPDFRLPPPILGRDGLPLRNSTPKGGSKGTPGMSATSSTASTPTPSFNSGKGKGKPGYAKKVYLAEADQHGTQCRPT